MKQDHIYLLHEQQFVVKEEPVYKITQSNKSFGTKSPFWSLVAHSQVCKYPTEVEKALVNIFKEHFKWRPDLGPQYFEGDYLTMVGIIKKFSLPVVNTYEEYMSHSKIVDIIITDTRKIKGYLKFSNGLWLSFGSKGETLEGFISNASNFKNIDAKPICDYNAIIIDILKKLPEKIVSKYKLKYHEYIIADESSKFFVFNAKTFTFTNINDTVGIITESQLPLHNGVMFTTRIFDTPPSAERFQDIISDCCGEQIAKDFKKICYNIFIRKDSTKIFYDNWNLHNIITNINYILTGVDIDLSKFDILDTDTDNLASSIYFIKSKVPVYKSKLQDANIWDILKWCSEYTSKI
jgi:hypothetical protein